MTYLAQSSGGIEIGEWFQEGLFWFLDFAQTPLDYVRDINTWLIENVIGIREVLSDTGLVALPWFLFPVAFAAIAFLTGRPTRGLRAAGLLLFVRALGEDIWADAQVTLALTLVGVAMGLALALIVGALTMTSRGLRRAVRRFVDASVLVTFTALGLPFVFLFGLGQGSALLMTAVAATAVLLRPVVATFDGDPETGKRFAFTELAAGVNTALVMSVIFQEIQATIGGGGLGRVSFRAVNNLNLSLHVTAVLAILGVALAVDQLSRPTSKSSVFLGRNHAGWGLVPTSETEIDLRFNRPATMIPTVAGAAIALVSLLLPWASDRGTITSHLRFADRSQPGISFHGLAELGGSGFGYAVGALAVGALAGVALRLVRGSGPPADFTMAIGASIVVLGAAFVSTAASPLADSGNVSIGAIVAIVGGVIITVGSLASRGGAWSDVRPDARLGYAATMVGLAVGAGLVVLGSAASWVVDNEPPVRTPIDLSAEIQRLREEAGDDVNKQVAAAQQIQELMIEQDMFEPVHVSGLDVDGPHTGFSLLAAGGVSLVGALVLLVFGLERARWLAMGFGIGGALASAAWISSTAIPTPDPLGTQGGPLLTLIGSAALAAVARRAPIRERNVLTSVVPAIPAKNLSFAATEPMPQAESSDPESQELESASEDSVLGVTRSTSPDLALSEPAVAETELPASELSPDLNGKISEPEL